MLKALPSPIAPAGYVLELAPQDLDQEVAVPAGRLEEGAVRVARIPTAGKHVRHQVEHRLDLALVRIDLCQPPDPLPRPDLAITPAAIPINGNWSLQFSPHTRSLPSGELGTPRWNVALGQLAQKRGSRCRSGSCSFAAGDDPDPSHRGVSATAEKLK